MSKNADLKILFLDIETAPNLAHCWGKYDQTINNFVKERYMLSFSCKWLGDRKTEVYGLPDFPGYSKNKTCDKALCEKLWERMDEADIVCAHNGDKFDIRIINARFLINNLNPPSPYKTVDTIKLARKHFGFNSNKLNDISKNLGIGTKVETGGFQLWLDCMDGKSAAWKKMKKYNKFDVILLEKVYLRLRPWSTTHPSVAVHSVDKRCNNCGSTRIQLRGFNYTKMGKAQRWQCKDCGSWSSGSYKKK